MDKLEKLQAENEKLKKQLGIAEQALQDQQDCGECCPINYCTNCQNIGSKALEELENE